MKKYKLFSSILKRLLFLICLLLLWQEEVSTPASVGDDLQTELEDTEQADAPADSSEEDSSEEKVVAKKGDKKKSSEEQDSSEEQGQKEQEQEIGYAEPHTTRRYLYLFIVSLQGGREHIKFTLVPILY